MVEPQESGTPDLIPLKAFLGQDMEINPATKDLVLQADLILGVDNASGQEYVVYGKAKLKRIAETDQAEDVRVLRVGIDASTEDLDKLCGLVMALRGRFDYGTDWETR